MARKGESVRKGGDGRWEVGGRRTEAVLAKQKSKQNKNKRPSGLS